MKSSRDIEKLFKDLHDTTNAEMDERVLRDVSQALEDSNRRIVWRMIMKSKITKLATAAAVILAVVLTVTVLDKSVAPAYAIEQTIEAMEKVTTVHMFCRDWDSREFEMWMTLSLETGYPEYCYAYWPDYEVTNISTPTTSYQYNKNMNQVLVSKGKLYHFDVRFDRMFEDLLGASEEKKDNIKIYRQANFGTGKSLIVITCEGNKDTAWKFFVDPETKLPVSIHCLKSNQPGQFIRDFDEIHFNDKLPEGIFEFHIPENASVSNMDEEMKLLSDPNYGLSADGLTEQEAAEQIASEYWQAIVEEDLVAAKKVYPSTNANRSDEEIKAKYREVFGVYMPVALVEVGQLYVEHGCGIGKVLPCTVEFEDGSLKEVKIIIKFRKIDGQSSCVIAGHYGYPVRVE